MNQIHLIVQESPVGVQILGAYADPSTARHHLGIHESVCRNPSYHLALQVDQFDNEEGAALFEEDWECYDGSESLFLVIEKGNPLAPGDLAVAAFTERDDADNLVERRHAFNGQSLSVVPVTVDFSEAPTFYDLDT